MGKCGVREVMRPAAVSKWRWGSRQAKIGLDRGEWWK
jgi:hypothetical protein